MSIPFDVFTQLDRLASSAFDTARAPRLMPVDLFRDGDQYVLSADLPGIDPESVDVDLDGQLLTIRAERMAPTGEGVKWLSHERPYGSYMRQFTLGDGVDVERIAANYEHGVLSVIVPIAEKAKPRKISISAANLREDQRSGRSRHDDRSAPEPEDAAHATVRARSRRAAPAAVVNPPLAPPPRPHLAIFRNRRADPPSRMRKKRRGARGGGSGARGARSRERGGEGWARWGSNPRPAD